MEPSSSRRPHGLAFVLHCLAPTPTTTLCYLILSIIFIVGHMIGVALSGTTLPANIDQRLLEQYTHYVIGPVITLMNNDLFNSLFTIVLWGIIGLAICTLITTAASRLNEWRNAERDITIPAYGVVVHHPLRRTLIIRLLWQLLIAILIALLTALILPLVRYNLDSDIRAMQSPSLAQGLYISAITAFIWMLIFHAYVILFRLYVLRTRVFGEILR